MRWPLKNKILIRMMLLLLLTIAAITVANIRLSVASNRRQESERLDRIVDLVTTARFPLTSPVLENMKSLSGAEFVLQNRAGITQSKTESAPDEIAKGVIGDPREEAGLTEISFDAAHYYLRSVDQLQNRNGEPAGGVLYILVPRQSRFSIWWAASKSPLIIALIALPLALLLSLAMASQVTRPLAQLESQVKRIADGDIQQLSVISGSREVHELSESIDDMAIKLQDHEAQLRKNERLKTMVQFGSSIAHHLRNSATGCKMAVELLAAEDQKLDASENYQVARRQLGLMNNYIKKFLLLSKSPETNLASETQWIDLQSILNDVIFLLRPSATHLKVQLDVDNDCDGSKIQMSYDDAEQLMMNLITNAIAAASQFGADGSNQACVSVGLQVKDRQVKFSVTDSGQGPPDDIADSIFQPFVTGSEEGTGLGLSLVADVAARTGGEIQWKREQDQTVFTFKLNASDSARLSAATGSVTNGVAE